MTPYYTKKRWILVDRPRIKDMETSNVTLVTHKVLFKKTGENFTTPADPYRPFVEGKDEALLSVKETFCVSFDNDMLVQGNLYEVYDVVLPSWMSVEEWCSNVVKWKYTWASGVGGTWSESWQRALSKFSTVEKLALTKLLRTKSFRSEFRKSMRAQVEAWLNTPADQRKYEFPLSPKQMDCLCDVYTSREARGLDNDLYNNRTYRGVLPQWA